MSFIAFSIIYLFIDFSMYIKMYKTLIAILCDLNKYKNTHTKIHTVPGMFPGQRFCRCLHVHHCLSVLSKYLDTVVLDFGPGYNTLPLTLWHCIFLSMKLHISASTFSGICCPSVTCAQRMERSLWSSCLIWIGAISSSSFVNANWLRPTILRWVCNFRLPFGSAGNCLTQSPNYSKDANK